MKKAINILFLFIGLVAFAQTGPTQTINGKVIYGYRPAGSGNTLYLTVNPTTNQLEFQPAVSGIPLASQTVAGISKIYNSTGINTDGSMTQQAITDALFFKADVSYVDNLKIDLQNTAFVAKSGDDATAEIGNPAKSYLTIQAAVNASTGTVDNPQVILIYPGIYEEAVDAIGKYISLVGVDKGACRIVSNTGNYETPPLECSAGVSAYNLTFEATNLEGDGFYPSYAIHMDFAGEGVSRFINCDMISHVNAAMGIGLHENQTLIIDNCQLYKYSDGRDFANAALFMHNNLSNGVLNQRIEVKNSYIYSDKGLAIQIDDSNKNTGGTGNDMSVSFQNNVFSSMDNGLLNSYFFTASTTGDLAGKIKLTEDSFGNSIRKLNYINEALLNEINLGTLAIRGTATTLPALYINKGESSNHPFIQFSNGVKFANIEYDRTGSGEIGFHNSINGTVGSISESGDFVVTGQVAYNSTLTSTSNYFDLRNSDGKILRGIFTSGNTYLQLGFGAIPAVISGEFGAPLSNLTINSTNIDFTGKATVATPPINPTDVVRLQDVNAYAAKTANYTLTATDGVIDFTSGSSTATLPTAVGISGKRYFIKNSGSGVTTIATTSSQTIDGISGLVLFNQNSTAVLVSDGANWKIIDSYGTASVLNSTMNTAQTAATLNSAYPSAPVPFVLYAPNVNTGMVYIKTTTGGQWMQYSGSLLNP